MSTPEELTAQITELGNKIKEAKADKQPKELWDEHLQAMLKAKVRESWATMTIAMRFGRLSFLRLGILLLEQNIARRRLLSALETLLYFFYIARLQ